MPPTRQSVNAWSSLLTFTRDATIWLDARLSESHGLTLEEYDVIYQLSRTRLPMRMTEVAEVTLIARSSCTRVVDRLVERGLVDRQQSTSDRRSVTIALTSSGTALCRDASRSHGRDITSLMNKLETCEVEELERMVMKLSLKRQVN
jgi:DNA-binding MarR family transcriptional regulator